MLGFGLAQWLVLFAGHAAYQVLYVWLQAIVGWSIGAHVTEIVVGYVSVLRFQYRGAACRIGLLPVSGWTNFRGMDEDEQFEVTREVTLGENGHPAAIVGMKLTARVSADEPEGDAETDGIPFNRLHPLKRIAVMAVGPIACFCIAVGILWLTAALGRTEPVFVRQPAVIGWCRPDSALAQAGLQVGDRVTTVGVAGETSRVESWRDLIAALATTSKQPIAIEAMRGDMPVTLQTTLRGCALFDVGHVTPDALRDAPPDVTLAHQGSEAFATAIDDAEQIAAGLVRALVARHDFDIENRGYRDNGYRRLNFLRFSGDWSSVWVAIAVIGMFNTVVNLAPIPPLNGGRIVFALWEWAGGRVNHKALGTLSCVGMVLVILLMLRVLMLLVV